MKALILFILSFGAAGALQARVPLSSLDARSNVEPCYSLFPTPFSAYFRSLFAAVRAMLKSKRES